MSVAAPLALPIDARRVRLAALVGIALGLLAPLVTILPGLQVETVVVPLLLAVAAVALGGWALTRGERRLAGYAVAAGVVGLLLALLAQEASATTVAAIFTPPLFAATLRFATPLAFAALGGLFSERAGVVNIGLEGIMLTGAFFGIWACDKADSWVVGLLGAAFFGGLVAFVYAVFAIHLRADQVVAGTAVNILALGVTTYAFRSIYSSEGTPDVPRIPSISIPGVRDLRWVGPVVGNMNLMIWLMLALVAATSFFLFKTPWGLRLRAVGEHPRAADTVGVDVIRVRYAAVVLSGVLGALGGAYLSFGLLSSFNENMTNGRGFIALAALIFGKWRPWGLFAATLLFGFATAFGNSLQTIAGIDANFVSTLPYVLTLVALVGLVGRSTPPAASGLPYRRQ